MGDTTQKISFSLILSLIGLIGSPLIVQAEYWLVIGSYRQGPGPRPQVSGITSPSLFAIPMESLEACKKAGKKISSDIYKPVWQFDNRWSCVYDGKD
ncbi:hypothetical protein [Prochlorococcus marinus]|uniref:Possible GRAM domain n=1 Tax=Prochlorococcus marinus (strain MIT 9211) TaxID=93059 RepID=A9B9V0_PROM4|nr:hypothetical protein [Prochlorococcus marinus]ABX08612.1 possible GRAM domain [Prochlorococcus marinus str. MIT 9211]